MTRYLIFNFVWFSWIFFGSLFATRRGQRLFILVIIVGVATLRAFTEYVDPIGYLAYVILSFGIYFATPRFRSWSMAKSTALDDELDRHYKELDNQMDLLRAETDKVSLLQREARDLSDVYDSVKEMSQSLDPLEALWVLGEALKKHGSYADVRIVLYYESAASTDPTQAKAVYRASAGDFPLYHDRDSLLKDRKRWEIPLAAEDVPIVEAVFRNGRMIDTGRVRAYPVFVDEHISAIFMVSELSDSLGSAAQIVIDRFLSEIQRMKLYEKVQTLAITDSLTGVYVRRHLNERFKDELERSRRMGLKLSFLMIDIDHFKELNDRYGHLVGDAVLKEVARLIKNSVRELDLVSRFGGEEFGVLLVDTDELGAFFVAERIRMAIAEKPIRAYEESTYVSVSIGCATWSQQNPGAESLIESADAALYQAKREGRNRVCIANLVDSYETKSKKSKREEE